MQSLAFGAAAHRLVTYASADKLSKGLELTFNPKLNVADACRIMGANLATQTALQQASFVLVPFPGQDAYLGLERFVAALKSLEITGALCLVCELEHLPNPQQRTWLSSFGIQVALGNVGPRCRFSDLTENALCGFALNEAFLSEAAGNPRASSILASITALAKNLGALTFARCETDLVKDMACFLGVEYLAEPGKNRLHGGANMWPHEVPEVP